MHVRGMTHAWVYSPSNPIFPRCCNAADVLHRAFGNDAMRSVLGLQRD